jgi:hypothetical protein
MDDVERLRSCVNMPYFTVFTPLQNIINPVKKDLFLYKSLDQNLVPTEATGRNLRRFLPVANN